MAPRMDGEYCNEYTVGCCPLEEFFVQSVTKGCTRIHDEGRRAEYAGGSQPCGFELAVLQTYRNITEEADKKIQHNERCLLNAGACEDAFSALDYAERLIEEKTFGASDSDQLYQLLKMHGQLLQRAAAGAPKGSYTVCGTCGAIKTEDVCRHHFCAAYGKVRTLCRRMEARLGFK